MDPYATYARDHLLGADSPEAGRKKVLKFMHGYRSLLPPAKDAAILEIGPGLGEVGVHLTFALGYAGYEAVDISNDVVAHCRDVRRLAATQVDDVATFLETRAGTYDLVFMLQVLEHVPKAQTVRLLAAIRTALKPGATLLVEVPNVSNFLVGPTYRYTDFTHEVGFTHASLGQVLIMAGFGAIDIRAVTVPLDSPLRWVQRALQAVMNFVQRSLVRIYIPGTRDLYSPDIYAVARR